MTDRTFNDVVIDRIGVDSSISDQPSAWSVVLAGEDRIRTIHRINLVDASHLPITKPGDRVRLAFADGRIKGFANLSHIGTRLDAHDVERQFLVPPPPAPWWLNIIFAAIGIALMGGMFWAMVSMMNGVTNDLTSTLNEMAEENSAANRNAVAKEVVAKCPALASKASEFSADGKVDESEFEVLDTLIRRTRAEAGIAACPIKAPLDAPSNRSKSDGVMILPV
jgi:hypothetical protein